MFMLAGLFAIIVATRFEDKAFKEKVIGFAARWVIPAAILTPPLLLWYFSTLPEATVTLFREGVTGVMGGRLEALTRYFWLAISAGFLIVAGTAFVAWRPRVATTAGAIALFVIAQFGFMGGEFFREMARKPYVVYGTLYSNSLWQEKAEDPDYMGRPYLEQARWAPPVEPLSAEHGEWLWRLQCSSCHTWQGYRSLAARTENWSGEFGLRWFETMHETGVMPPFQGTLEDRAALAAWIVSSHGGQTVSAAELVAAERSAALADALWTVNGNGAVRPGADLPASGREGGR